MTDLTFCYVMRPYALGVNSLSILMAPMRNGDFEAFALCETLNGRSDAKRLTFHKSVDVTSAIQEAQNEAQSLLPDPSTPVVWVGSTNKEAMYTELGFAFGAVEEALRYVEAPALLDVIARVRPAAPPGMR